MTSKLLSVSGIIHYDKKTNKVVANISPDFIRYYRSLVPKYYGVNPPKYPSHCSIVRNEVVDQLSPEWGKREGEKVRIFYKPEILSDKSDVYWWVDAWCDVFCNLRVELGLPAFRLKSGNRDGDRFHITIGNTKNK